MSSSKQNLQHFTLAIAGLWYNPETNNRYRFIPDVHDISKGQVGIVQHPTNTLIDFNIELKEKDGLITITVDGSEYEVHYDTSPQSTLRIKIHDGLTVTLLKY